MKKWLLSKLLFLLGISSFAQVFQSGNFPQNTLLNDVSENITGTTAQFLNASPHVSGEVHPELAAALQHMLDSLTAEFGAVGVSGALLLPSDDLWKGASGINSTALGDTLSTEMRMGMGSVTKTFTATAIMKLVEDGVLTLEDSIGQWLPAYPNIDSSITIRHLLNHTSGIYNYTDSPEFFDFIDQNLDSIYHGSLILENFINAPVFPPGSTWGYSNTNYVLLGLIIEAATGKPFYQEIRERLLDPNDHTTMSMHPHETPTGEVAHLWLDFTGDGVVDDFTANGMSLNSLFSGAGAAGALMATPEDLAYWIKNLATGQVTTQSTLDQMKETVFVNSQFEYGLGLIKIKIGGITFWGHTGGIFYQTYALYSPDYDLTIVLMTNDAQLQELDFIFIALIQTYFEFQPNAVGEMFYENNNLIVYPNPFSNDLIVAIDLEKPSPVQLTVTNQIGQVVYQMDYGHLSGGMNNFHLKNCGHWPKGIYQIQLQGEDWMILEKAIKE